MAERAPGASMRRRHRQLRAFHRHERLTVRMELATALHHSAQPTGPVVEEPREVEAQDTYAAPRGQKEPSPGTRPGVLKDPEPQARCARRKVVCDAVAPLLVSLHVVDDAHIDHSSLRFLLAQNLAAQKEKEEKEQKARRQVLLQEFSALLAVPVRSRSLLQVSRLEALAEALDSDSSAAPSSQAGRRKRKKRRRRRLPRGVRIRRCGQGFRSRSSLSGAQCSLLLSTGLRCSASWPVCTRRTAPRSSSFIAVACAMLVWLVTMHPRVMFPSGSASCPIWTRRTVLFVFVVNHCSGMYKVGFTGDSAPRAVFLSLLSSGPDARHHGRYEPEGQLRGEILADMVPMVQSAENCGFPQLQFIMVVEILS